MIGERRLSRVVIALNMAARGSRFGPIVARFVYWAWNAFWDSFFAIRGGLFGYAATFRVLERQLRFDTRDRTVTRALYVFREYEPTETYLLSTLLRPGMIVVDIGANTGYYTVMAASAVGPRGRVIAFEPNPRNLSLLRENVSLNGLSNVVVEECAITAAPGAVTLFLCGINDGDHRIYDGGDDGFYNAGRPRATIEVRATSLDCYVEASGVKPDVIKMDVQGAEYVALQGMKRTLVACEDVVLMAEYWPYGLERCGGNPEDSLRELTSLGFRVYLGGVAKRFEEMSIEAVQSRASGRDSVSLFFSRRELT